ncbi:hypothetical protein SAV14893_091490 [Streptomyces avermitilis]|uniref:Uncharacterized protein n=2 Tax=Streptomyces avermitilis TaxID=33903 RepID=Q82QU3_STRAW|nr:hypothetical protein SAVERM_402 [Streptomyces avermitilis MA-4680 = NBRC 14893]BBJ47870.1 hypothetical protein SAVMC3_04990 [Streptomyces avermitilis]GDY69756.1 hypothetical protein SAV14893_091490 [Streptomyces avermitilis]
MRSWMLTQIEALAHRTAVPPVAGDDPAAKAEVVRLLDVLGYDAVDIGALANAWHCEPGTLVYVWPYLGERSQRITKEEARLWFREIPGEPTPADWVKELIDQAVRGPVGGSFAALPFRTRWCPRRSPTSPPRWRRGLCPQVRRPRQRSRLKKAPSPTPPRPRRRLPRPVRRAPPGRRRRRGAQA